MPLVGGPAVIFRLLQLIGQLSDLELQLVHLVQMTRTFRVCVPESAHLVH